MNEDLKCAIKETQAVLEPLFNKPKLTTKLLGKPPFRFIHDIITATLRETGFPAGYFSDSELDSTKLRENRQLKTSFLERLIKLVEAASGEEQRASSSEIVAGLGALHTNTLLVTFGRLATDVALDRDALVVRCLSRLPVEDFAKNSSKKEEKTASSKEQDSGSIRGPSPRYERSLTEVDDGENGRVFQALELCNGDLDRTKELLTNLVVKPKPSDKLLGRPPFRFIHDLLLSVCQSTGFDLKRPFGGQQIFSDDEMISSNVKEKGAKLDFLTKLVNFVESVVGKHVDVIPANVVSGLEAERTRYMLQLFCVIATNSTSLTNNDKLPLSSVSDHQDKTMCEDTSDNEGGVPEAGGDGAGGEGEEGEVKKVASEDRPSLDGDCSAENTCYPDLSPPFISAEQPGDARPVPGALNAVSGANGHEGVFAQQSAQKYREGHLTPSPVTLPSKLSDNVIRSLANALPQSIEPFALLLSNIEEELLDRRADHQPDQ